MQARTAHVLLRGLCMSHHHAHMSDHYNTCASARTTSEEASISTTTSNMFAAALREMRDCSRRLCLFFCVYDLKKKRCGTVHAGCASGAPPAPQYQSTYVTSSYTYVTSSYTYVTSSYTYVTSSYTYVTSSGAQLCHSCGDRQRRGLVRRAC